MFITNKLRGAWANARRNTKATRNDEGFSFAQVIVTMVIVGILGGAIGFTAFQFIGQSRETVLAANIRTAADAVQNSMALNPNLKASTALATGVPTTGLLSELSNTAGFTWKGDAFPFVDADGVDTVRIQMINQDGTAVAATTALTPVVDWLVGDQDAVRVQIKNEDNAWACALIVLRPNWATGTDTQQATAEANLRGIWYDAGSNIPGDNGLHHCSPTTVATMDRSNAARTADYGIGIAPADKGLAPLPFDGSNFAIPFDGTPGDATVEDDDGLTAAPADDIDGRLLQRSVPDFAAN